MEILFSDKDIAVCVKPVGCDSEKELPKMLSEALGGDMYTVHRLDKNVGGVMVYAKSSKAASRLSEQMRSGDFEKKYMTVLSAIPQEERAVLRHYVKKNPINNMVYACPPTVEGAKFCELEYMVLQKANGMALTKVILHTGRTHQIRVQSATIGCPVYGDMRYGGEKAKKGFLALWATSLAFTHPVSKERLVFKIEPPKENTPWNLFDVSKEIQDF